MDLDDCIRATRKKVAYLEDHLHLLNEKDFFEYYQLKSELRDLEGKKNE